MGDGLFDPEGESFLEPAGEADAGGGSEREVEHLVEQSGGEAALGEEARRGLEADEAASGGGGEKAGVAGGVTESGDGGIDTDDGADANGASGEAFGFAAGAFGDGGDFVFGGSAGAVDVEGFGEEGTPGDGVADLSAGEVGGENLGEGVAGLAAFLGAGLTESNAVSGAPTFDDGVGVVEVEVVELGADMLPAEGAAEAEVEGFGVEGAAVGVEGGDAAGGGAAGDGELGDLREAEGAGELVEGETGAPGLASGGEAEGVFPALQPGAGGAGPDGGGGFGVAAAVAAVEDLGGAAIGFEDESFGVFDDLAEAGGDVADEEFLAVGGFAEVEAFGFVAAGVDAGEGANGDGHGFEGFGGGEAAGFPGEGGGNVVFAVEAEGVGFTGDADAVVLGGQEDGGPKKERDQGAHWAKISPARGAACWGPVPEGRATTRRSW